jgi:PelA/Pel-15E family pectate lyase
MRALLLLSLPCLLLASVTAPGFSVSPALTWKECLRQSPEWYRGAEAIRVAENLLLYQRDSGGWPKNVEMTLPLDERQRVELRARKSEPGTIDNGATHGQVQYLARVTTATKQERFRAAFERGLDALRAAQYANGGWPQVFPRAEGYSRHITFNDDAMVGVLNLLRDIAHREPEYRFVDAARRAQAERAVRRGIDCILKCQITVDGARTVWCAQYDERTLAPTPARAYEKVSQSGAESVGIVRFLMGIEKPSPEVVAAVESAVAWFERVKLTGIRLETRTDPALPGGRDRVIVADPNASPLWARFYAIGTNRPIFCGRDGVVKSTLAEIEHERRIGYAWYTERPAALLAKEYPAWRLHLASSE